MKTYTIIRCILAGVLVVVHGSAPQQSVPRTTRHGRYYHPIHNNARHVPTTTTKAKANKPFYRHHTATAASGTNTALPMAADPTGFGSWSCPYELCRVFGHLDFFPFHPSFDTLVFVSTDFLYRQIACVWHAFVLLIYDCVHCCSYMSTCIFVVQ